MGVKWAAIRRIISKHKVDLVCIQETKRENFNKNICQAIWGDSTAQWDYVPSVQAAGGLLCMWNNSTLEVVRRVKSRSFLMLEGRCILNDQRLVIINVYAPCDLDGKKALWDDLRQLKVSNPGGLWCVLGDFNSIRSAEERVSLSQRRIDPHDIATFNQWISDLELQEIKSVGPNYTWIRPNGYVKSRLDRFLVSDQWLSLWPDCCQHVLQRDLSDHCPIILQTNMVDWGPKPFRVFDWWLQQKQYQKLVRDTWSNDQQGGWGSIALKNKLKNLKAVLKQWSKGEGTVDANKISSIQKKLNEMEDLASNRILSDQEIQIRNSLQQDLWNASNALESLLRQKSRVSWLKEGDCNSGYFHRIINYRRAYNAIPGIYIDGVWVQQPISVKKAAVNYFQTRFTEQNYSRPQLDGVGSGESIKFWTDNWLGEQYNLQQKYHQLFLISRQQKDHISQMGHFTHNIWTWDLRWRRNLFDHESLLAVQFMEDISSVPIQRQVKDNILWLAESNGQYSTREAFSISLQDSRVTEKNVKVDTPEATDFYVNKDTFTSLGSKPNSDNIDSQKQKENNGSCTPALSYYINEPMEMDVNENSIFKSQNKEKCQDIIASTVQVGVDQENNNPYLKYNSNGSASAVKALKVDSTRMLIAEGGVNNLASLHKNYAHRPNTSSEKGKLVSFTPTANHSNSDLEKLQILSDSKKILSQTALAALIRKRNELALQQRKIEDEIAVCDKKIQRMLTDGEDDFKLKIESIVEGCNDTWELDNTCHENNWVLPTYHLSHADGGFKANVTVKGVDFQCSFEGNVGSNPSEARESAAALMLTNLKEKIVQ
ncbi:hypothetical protein HKD37_11G031208 [Glycine soja]